MVSALEEGLSVVKQEQELIEKRVSIVDSLGRSYGTGRRKSSVARVWIKPGVGLVKINGRDMSSYFSRPVLEAQVLQPFTVLDRKYDVWCTVKGGGHTGQAGAIRHGISRAILNMDPVTRVTLKRAGLLTRDSRVVERKKYGQPGARRKFQFSKR